MPTFQNQKLKQTLLSRIFKTTILIRFIKNDNDYQSLQKIQSSVKAHGYTNDDLNNLLAEIKTLFLTDNKFDVLEQNVFRGLKHIFK